MKKISLSIILFAAIFLLYSCGGVIGNIEKYPFPNVNPDSLKAALNKVYIKYPELIKTDTSMYGNNDGEHFYYVLNDNKQKIIFKCNVVVYPAPYDKEIDLSLTSATTWGKIMDIAPEMGFFEKRKYKKLFKKNILPKIKEELKGE
jgi:hypothetical protein